MNTTNHTPTPWKVTPFHSGVFYVDQQSNNSAIAAVDGEQDAAFIVRACNSHDELVKALECNNRSLFWFLSFLGEELSFEHRKQVFKIIEDARTALTHAKG